MYIDADTINNLAKLLCSMVVIGWQGRYRGYFNR